MTRHLGLFLAVVGFNLFAGFGVAQADPVTAAITTILTTVGVSASIASAIASFTVALLKNVGMSLLGQALSKKPKIQNAGIKTQTSTGGSVPQTFVLGQRATAGQLVTPLMSYGKAGKTENAFLVYVIALGCIPGQAISQVILNDEYVTVADTLSDIGAEEGVKGYALGGVKYEGHAWLRYHNGSQTDADPVLMSKLSGYPERPWSSTMVGKGMCYAVLVFKYNREVLNAPPSVRFVMDGIRLYDPRKDGSLAGHSGSHRWGNAATYEHTLNPAVMMYNLHRGIALPDGSVYGGEAQAEDLPVANWIAAMNACDHPETLDTGGSEARFTAGLEVSLSDEPADVMEALETACQAQQVEIGGVWKIRVGGPGAPVLFVTDDDILIDHDRNHDMFPGLNETHNGIQASHPLPSALWEMTDAPVRYNADLEKEDDGRRLIADLTLPAVFSPTQAQRLMKSYIDEERRFRRHYLTMGPYASMLEPLDAIAWTSASEGYDTKLFEVTTVNEGLRTLNVELGLRERDSDDFTWSPEQELPWAVGRPRTPFPDAQAVPDFEVTGITIADGAGRPRKPAVQLAWDGDDMPAVRGVMYDVRLKANLSDVAAGTTADVTRGGIVVTEGILPATAYQARARLMVDRPTNWSSWRDVTTPDIRLSEFDLPHDLVNKVNTGVLDLLKLRSDFTAYRQITEALLYAGDGRSTQLVSLSAETKAVDAITRFDLIGALTPDSSAYILNSGFVQVNASTTLASFVSSTTSKLGDHTASIDEVRDAVDGVKANYFLRAKAGTDLIAGLYLGADDTAGTSSVGFIAQNFFFADNTDPDNVVTPFVYQGGKWTIHGDMIINGSLVVTDTITTEKLKVNAVSEFAQVNFGGTSDLSSEKTVCALQFNPNGGRVRVSFRIAIDNPGSTEAAIRIKVFSAGTNISGSLLFITRPHFTTIVTTYVYDPTTGTANRTYTINVETVTGTNIGHDDGEGYTAHCAGGNITLESFKR